MVKSKSRYFFGPKAKPDIFFWPNANPEIFFQKKTYAPPLKSNGRCLKSPDMTVGLDAYMDSNGPLLLKIWANWAGQLGGPIGLAIGHRPRSERRRHEAMLGTVT